jgi:parallel beta-helix repeat protein
MKTKQKAKEEEANATRSLLKSGLCAALVVSLALMAFTMTASAGVINVPTDQATIQAAINAAGTGDTVIVHDGTYKENLVVNKSDLIIRSANGSAVTIISSNQTDTHVVNITVQTNVTLDNFTIRDAQGNGVAGIYMYNASACTISNNIVTNISATKNAYGIWLHLCFDNTFNSSTSVSDIRSTSGDAYGIYLLDSDDNAFSSSTAVSPVMGDSHAYGICLSDSSNNNTFSSSTAVSNVTADDFAYGISLWSSDNNTFNSSSSVSNITANLTAEGIALRDSDNNRFSANTSVSNITANSTAEGIYLQDSDNNRFSSSTSVSHVSATTNNAFGIWLFSSNNNNFSSSTSVSNITADDFAYGIYLLGGGTPNENNKFHNCIISDISSGTPTTSAGIQISGDPLSLVVEENNLFAGGRIFEGDGPPIDYGVSISWSKGNIIMGFEIRDCAHGVWLSNSADNTTINGNMIVNNTGGGTGVNISADSKYNELHENCFIANEPQARDDETGKTNNWAGNFWDDWDGLGPYGILGDADSEDSSPLAYCNPYGDDDGDGVPNGVEGTGDSDGDGIPDFQDPDDDGDGVSTVDEDVNGNGDPTDDDTDSDGVPDYLDDDDDNDGIPTRCEDVNGDGDPTNDDTNRNRIPNYRDPEDRISICAVPALTPIGLVALVGLLSAIAAVSIQLERRKRR